MSPRNLTPVELADLLNAASRQDRGLSCEGPDLELAYYLGCHSNVQEDKAQYWLDVEFVEPCPS